MSFSKTVFIGQVLYAIILGCVKISISLNFQRIFFTRSFRLAANCVIAFTLLWMLQTIFTGVFICHPVQVNWNPAVRGNCGNQTLAFTFVSVVDMITDLCLLALPIRPLLALRMRTSQKIALGSIFTGGFV